MDVMTKIFSQNVNFLFHNNSGATAIEYALIAMGIAVVIIGAVTLVGGDLSNVFGSVATGL